MRGRFITFEGVEGSGKTTQISLLADYFREAGKQVTLSREPGGTAIGDQIRKILLDPGNKSLDPTAELLLYSASRAQHLREVIIPALDAGRIVLCDRFSDATLAYQGYGRGLDLEKIAALDRIVTAELRPHLTLLLDIESEAGLSRARGRNASSGLELEARFENEALAFHERVRRGYLALAKRETDRMRVVDASRAVPVIHAEIRKIVEECLQMP